MTGRKTLKRTTYAGRLLTEQRLQKGLSQQKVANRVGVALRVYQRLETGEMPFHDLRIKYGLSLCMLLDLDPYMLTFGAGFTAGCVFEVIDPETALPPDPPT